ncbi:MAG: hypothetical protein ACREQV_01635 [Candidatus Binatia bacterium]
MVYKHAGELFRALCEKGGGFSAYADILDQAARSMLERTRIINNVERARLLLDALDRLPTPVEARESSEGELWFELFRLLCDNYAPIVDDLLLISAFEMAAKASLLRAGYVIHEIETPKDLRACQRKRPVHRRTVRASITRGTDVQFSDRTIGMPALMEPKYFVRHRLPRGAASALREVQGRRNLVHFQMLLMWGVDRDLISLVEHLDRSLPAGRSRSKRLPQRRA